MLHPTRPITTTTDLPASTAAEPARAPAADAPDESERTPRKATTSSKPPADAKRGWRSIDAPSRVEVAEVGSRFLYVAEQGTVMRRSGTRVTITKKETVLLDVPAVRLQGVLVYGNVQVSTQCLRMLMAEGVWVSFFSRNGQYKGRMQPPAERGGRLRHRQWTQSTDEAFCLAFAKAIVRGKILAERQVASAYAKNRAAESLTTGAQQLRESLERVEQVTDVASLRGVEGTATRAYFGLFAKWNGSDLPFEGREKRGTTDPVNSLLNFGYTLLTRELEGLVEAAGLDPTIGFYHVPDDDRPSLACDWVEEFRHGLIDRLVLTLVNKGTITRADFEEAEEHRGIRMSPDGLRKYFTAYERAMRRSPNDEDEAAAVAGVRTVMLAQLGRLLDAIAGRAPYRTHLEAPAPTPDMSVSAVVASEAAPSGG